MEGISLNWVGRALFQAFKAVHSKKTLLFLFMECMRNSAGIYSLSSFVWSY